MGKGEPCPSGPLVVKGRTEDFGSMSTRMPSLPFPWPFGPASYLWGSDESVNLSRHVVVTEETPSGCVATSVSLVVTGHLDARKLWRAQRNTRVTALRPKHVILGVCDLVLVCGFSFSSPLVTLEYLGITRTRHNYFVRVTTSRYFLSVSDYIKGTSGDIS